MIRHPCSRREGGSRVRAGLEYSSLEAANGRSLLCRKGSGALLRAVYAFSVMVMRCWAATTGSSCHGNIRGFDPDQFPGGGRRYAAGELSGVPLVSSWGREECFLSAGGGRTDELPVLPNKGPGGDQQTASSLVLQRLPGSSPRPCSFKSLSSEPWEEVKR